MLSTCGTCRYFRERDDAPEFGDCHRYPLTIGGKHIDDFCGEYELARIPDELLQTSVFAVGWFSADTMATLRRNKVATIADLIDFGRLSIRTPHGDLARGAVNEISKRLAQEGINW